MNMKADIYIQQNSQTSSGNVTRKWLYDQTIPCKIMAVSLKGGRAVGDDKSFTRSVNGYQEDIHLKMQSPIILSKRWRISAIRTNDNQPVFFETDRFGQEDTIYEVVSNHAVLDPFGRIVYYEANLRRAVIQDNDTATV